MRSWSVIVWNCMQLSTACCMPIAPLMNINDGDISKQRREWNAGCGAAHRGETRRWYCSWTEVITSGNRDQAVAQSVV